MQTRVLTETFQFCSGEDLVCWHPYAKQCDHHLLTVGSKFRVYNLPVFIVIRRCLDGLGLDGL